MLHGHIVPSSKRTVLVLQFTSVMDIAEEDAYTVKNGCFKNTFCMGVQITPIVFTTPLGNSINTLRE